MNSGQLMSTGRSVVLFVLGIISTMLVNKGVMTSDQASTLVPEIATALVGAAGVAVAYFGQKTHSAASVVTAATSVASQTSVGQPASEALQSSLVAAVNSQSIPGVKVVAETSQSPAVSIDPSSGNISPVRSGSGGA